MRSTPNMHLTSKLYFDTNMTKPDVSDLLRAAFIIKYKCWETLRKHFRSEPSAMLRGVLLQPVRWKMLQANKEETLKV